MASDIVERLQSHMYKADMSEVLADCRIAADEIEALRTRCEKAEAALEFVLATKIVPVGDEHAGAHNGKTLIQCHTAARSALSQFRKGKI